MSKYKQGSLLVGLNSLDVDNTDPSITKATFVIHDFSKCKNNQVVSKEVAEASMHTLEGKPVVCRYIPGEENDGLDALTDHELALDVYRDGSGEFVTTKTIAIGYFEKAYIGEVETENGKIEALLGDAVLWADKYPNIIGLLNEWLEEGVEVPTSVEFAYQNYSMNDGVEYVDAPLIYLAHAILNAEDRNKYKKVLPAYDSSKMLSMQNDWDMAVAQQVAKAKEENIMFKKVCQISLTERIGKIYQVIREKMSASEFDSIWISDYLIYDDHFIMEEYVDEEWKYYKVMYTISENDEIEVDLEGKVEVETVITFEEVQKELKSLKTELEGISVNESDEVAELEAKIAELESRISELEKEVEEKDAEIEELSAEKTELEEAVEELEEVEKEYNAVKFNEAYNQLFEEVSANLKAISAEDKLEDEEFIALIKKAVNSVEAKVELQEAIISAIPKVDSEPKVAGKAFNNAKVPTPRKKPTSFTDRYLK